MLYFGKTYRHHPDNYIGSGTYWLRHVKKHGKEHVITLWYRLFNDKTECMTCALIFSEKYNIVSSSVWANLKPENDLDGTHGQLSEEAKTLRRLKMRERGTNIVSPETSIKLSKAAKGKSTWIKNKHHTEETKNKQSMSLTGRVVSDLTKSRQSVALKNKPMSMKNRMGQERYFANRQYIECPHCGLKSKNASNMTRFHFTNCKLFAFIISNS